MTRTISIITATVGAALLFAVPAWGDNWAADKPQATVTVSPDWFERAAAVAIQKHESMLNARERGLGVAGTENPIGFDARSDGLNRLYGLGKYSNSLDSRERALVEKSTAKVEQPVVGFDARSDGLNRIHGLGEYAPAIVADDRFKLDPGTTPSGTVASSGTEIEWPQVGILFGVGIVLLLGLGLVMRAAHIRPFAH